MLNFANVDFSDESVLMNSAENKKKSDKNAGIIDCDSLLQEIERGHIRMREASAEADRYKEKFERAVSNAKGTESELRQQLDTLSDKLSEADLLRQTLEQKCILLEDKLGVERERFFKQEKELLEINQQNRHQAGEERRVKQEFEENLDAERLQREEVIKALELANNKLSAAEKERRQLEHEISVINSKYDKALQKEQESAREYSISAERESSRAEALLKENRDNKEIIDNLQQKLVALTDSNAILERNLESEVTRREKIEQEFSQTEQRLSLEHQRSQEESHAYQGKLLSARHDIAELEVRFERLNRKYNKVKFEYRRDRSELLGEYKMLQKQLDAQKFKLRETEKQMNVEKRVASNQVDQLRAQMRNALSQAEREKHDLTRQLDVLLKDSEDVRRRAEGFDVEVAEIRETYEDKIAALEKEVERISNALNKTSKAFEDESRKNEKLNAQTVNMRNLLADLEKRMRDTQAEHQNALKAKTGKYDELFDDHENLKRILKDAVNEKSRVEAKLEEVKAEETDLRGVLKNLKKEVSLMQESVSASSASKAYLKEKYEAVDSALNEIKLQLQQEKNLRKLAEDKLQLERGAFTKVEKELRTSVIAERDQLESEHSREVASYREEIDTLVKERDLARGDLGEERARNQELLQNLLTMREELELTHEASAAAKVFLKEKLAKAEETLEEYKSEFLLEEQRRQELERQLRELRRKMEFA